MTGVYDLQLVALSMIVAIMASYTALELAGRVSQKQGTSSWSWLVGGAVSMGTGIWSMHFIGMLAFKLPVAVAYDAAATMLSMAIAIVVSGLALFVVRRPTLTAKNLAAGATLMGVGISAMHYTGMQAMRMSPPIEYHPPLFIASVIIAIVASLAALWIAFQLRHKHSGVALLAKLGSATIMGLAITGMHYTGMAAAQFAPDAICLAVDSTGGMKSGVLALTVGIATICILALTQAAISLENALLYTDLRQENNDRKRAEEVLREQASLLDLTHDTVFVRDMNSVITYWNRGAEERYGWTRQEAVGKVAQQLLQTIFPQPLEKIDAELLRVDRWEGELIHSRRDGTPDVLASRWALRRDEAGKPVAILETNNDITERNRWRSLTEALPQLVWAATPDGACDYFSTQWTEYTGVPEAGLLGWRWMEVLHPDDRENTRKIWADSVAGRRPYDVEYRVRRHDAAYGWFKTRGTPIRNSEGRIIKWFGSCTDITDRKRAEEALHHSEQALRRARDELEVKVAERTAELQRSEAYLAEAQTLSRTGSFGWFVSSGEIFWSEETFRIFECDRAVEPTIEIILRRIHPEDAAQVEQTIARASQDGKDFAHEYRLLMPDGRSRHVDVVAHASRDAAGNLEFVGAVMDVTERKRAEEAQRTQVREREEMQRQLQQVAKMEAIGRLAGGIAHDFNNILGAILGYGELAQKNLEGRAVRRHVDQVMQAGARGKGLVERILAFSRSGLGERVPVHVQSVVEETLEILAASLASNVRLEKRLDAGDTAVVGDATQLHQVAMNLCTNALQAMEHGGVLTVALEKVAVPERRLLSHGTLLPGPYVRLTVSDTGSGIPPAVLERMFDPFFTTKGVGDGTGLGLSLVHGIVADFGGAIDVATQVGTGTTFTIWLPAAGQIPRLLAAEPAGVLPRGNGETVMIVDDEPVLVALAEETLAELGYEPVGFDSSLAALQAFRAEPKRFDLVLTDETMPDLTGTELAREMLQLRPDIPIILMSGYSGARLSERAQAAEVIDVLRKPLVRRDIALPVSRALQAGK